MGIKKVTEELRELLENLNKSCFMVSVYDNNHIKDEKFNSFDEAFDYKKSIKSPNRFIKITQISLEENFNTPDKTIFTFEQEETGYFLSTSDDKYQIYPEDNRKDNITNAILEFLEYEYDSNKEINSVSIKWLDFDQDEVKGKIEVCFYTE